VLSRQPSLILFSLGHKAEFLAMKTSFYISLLLVLSLRVSAAPDRDAGKSPETEFKARYHRWVATVYDHPGTLLSSDGSSIIDFPEYDAIVALGKPALPAIAREIEANGDMALFLGEAIIRITGWSRIDFRASSGQDFNRLLIERLRAEKLIPPKSP
jgi:hypothetical protein